MKVLQINSFGNLSTGRIAVDLCRTLRGRGHEACVAFARSSIAADVPSIRIGNRFSVYADGVLTRLTDKAGFYSRQATRRLIRQIKDCDPDVIHLHNLHGYYINIELLFDYLRQSGKPVVWTLHDCWAYTGHCCYYSVAGCDKWQTGCAHCAQKGTYPRSLWLDRSEWNHQKKRELFASLPNLHLVCVSNWLSEELKHSFLKDVSSEVIHNGIDLSVFRPTESDFRSRYGLQGQRIVLAVSASWGDRRKGLDDVLRLAAMVKDEYAVVIVGVTEKDRKRIRGENVIPISRTNSTVELAQIYSAADVFFNASTEETFGLPTVEAMACGTPVIVYDSTAVPEVVTARTGYVVRPHDLEAVKRLLPMCQKLLPWEIEEEAQKYSKELMLERYLSTYLRVMGR